MHFKGLRSKFRYYVFSLSLKTALIEVFANSVDPDEMPPYVAFHNHLGLHFLPKYLFNSNQNEEGFNHYNCTGIFLPFWGQGQGPHEFGKISFELSKLGILMQSEGTGLQF